MGVLSIQLSNYKKHKDFKFDFSNRSCILLGDSGEGKSTILDLLPAMLGLSDFDTKALSDGETKGFAKVEFDIDGKKFTITRTFSAKDKGRFTVTNEDGLTGSLDNMLNFVFGKAFTNKYFDYHKYFFTLKSPEARVEYFTKAIGNTKVLENIADIKALKKSRTSLNATVKANATVIEQFGFKDKPKEDIESEVKFYEKAREIDEAKEAKRLFLDNKTVRLEELENEMKLVEQMEENIAETQKNLTEIGRLEILISSLKKENVILEEERILLGEEKVGRRESLEKEIQQAKTTNEKVSIAAEELYEKEVKAISEHNVKRENFVKGLQSLVAYNKSTDELQKSNDKIEALEKESKEIFTKNLPIKELSYFIGDDGTEEIRYNGREFAWGNISKGESIAITSKIQRALNPNSANFILIPEAQSLGSAIDEILKEAKKFKLQVIMEITQRDEPLTIQFIEEANDTILTKKKAVSKRKVAVPKTK